MEGHKMSFEPPFSITGLYTSRVRQVWTIPAFEAAFAQMPPGGTLRSKPFRLSNSTFEIQLVRCSRRPRRIYFLGHNFQLRLQRRGEGGVKEDLKFSFAFMDRGKNFVMLEGSHLKRLEFEMSQITEKRQDLMPEGRLTVVCDVLLRPICKLSPVCKDYYADSKVNSDCLLGTGLKKNLLAAQFKALTDVELVVSYSSIRCHRTILAARSDVFGAIFRHQPDCRKIEVRQLERPKDLAHFVAAIYSDDYGNIGADCAVDLFRAADFYQLKGLKLACESAIAKGIEPDNAKRVADLTKLYSMTAVEVCQLGQPTNIESLASSLGGFKFWRSTLPGSVQFVTMHQDFLNAYNSNTLKADLKKLLHHKTLADFELVCKTGESHLCHKAILAARSSVFMDMFVPDTGLNRVETGLALKVQEKMLEAVYTDCIKDISEMELELFIFASTFALDKLREECEMKIGSSLNENNAFSLLSLACKTKTSSLKRFAARFVAEKAELITPTPEWIELLKKEPGLFL